MAFVNFCAFISIFNKVINILDKIINILNKVANILYKIINIFNKIINILGKITNTNNYIQFINILIILPKILIILLKILIISSKILITLLKILVNTRKSTKPTIDYVHNRFGQSLFHCNQKKKKRVQDELSLSQSPTSSCLFGLVFVKCQWTLVGRKLQLRLARKIGN